MQASSAEVKKTVLANLRKCFDCVIHNMGITEDDMRWASAMWTGLKHSGKNSKDISKDDSESDLRLEGDCGDAEDGAVENNVKNLTPDSKVKFMYSLPETTTSPCTMEMELNQSQLHDMWMRSVQANFELILTMHFTWILSLSFQHPRPRRV